MKILEPGKRPKWSMERKCTDCGAKLLVDWDDLFKTYTPRSEDDEEHVSFECPQCQVWNNLPKSKWPTNHDDIPSKKAWDEAKKEHPEGAK